MTCKFAPDGTIDAIAIERALRRVADPHVQRAARQGVITPDVALDLWPVVRDRYHAKLNLEGIVQAARRPLGHGQR